MSTRRAFLSAVPPAIALGACRRSRSQPKTAETVASGTPIAEPVLTHKLKRCTKTNQDSLCLVVTAMNG